MNPSPIDPRAVRNETRAGRPIGAQRRRIRGARALAVIPLLTAMPGCQVAAPTNQTEAEIHAPEDVSASQAQIRIRMRSLVEPFTGILIESADRILAASPEHSVRREALRWKMEAVPAVRESLFRPNPLVAVMDTWVLMWQMADYFESGHGQESLGEAAPLAVQTCQELAGQLESVAESMLISGDASDAGEFARRWAREHPIQKSIRGRESTLSRVTERELSEVLSTQEAVGSALVTLDDLSRRADVYSAQCFDQARWQAELIAMDLTADYDLKKVLPLLETAVQAVAQATLTLERLEPAVQQVAAVAASTPELVDRERSAAVEAVHEEVTRTLEFVQAERVAALDHVTRERKEALTELGHVIATEREVVLGQAVEVATATVDHAMLRLAQLAASALVASLVGAVGLLFLARRLFAARPRA